MWETVFVVGGTSEDTLLLRPRLLAARANRLYAYDYSDAQIKAFDSSGVLLWRFGRKGSGPAEFTNAPHPEKRSRRRWPSQKSRGKAASR